MATATQTQVLELYIGILGRGVNGQADVDQEGFDYWVSEIDAGKITIDGVSKNFIEESAEGIALFAGTTEETINQLYQNLFDRDAEATGSAYWASEIASGRLTLADAYKAIAAGAQGSDVTAFQAVVDAQAVHVGADDAAAFTLTASVEALATANDALDSFLLASNADGDDDATTASTPAEIATAASNATDAVDLAVTGDYEGSTATVKAAMLSSQVSVNAAALGVAQATLTEAAAAVAAVTGLTTAATAYTTATAATATAATAITTAETAASAGRASFLIVNDAQATITDTAVSATGAIAANIVGATTPFTAGETLTLTSVSAAGVVTLIDAATVAKTTTGAATATAEEIAFVEAQQALVTDVVALYNTLDTANDTFDAAEITEAAALQALNILDLSPAAKVDLSEIGAQIVVDGGAVVTTATPTVAEMTTHSEFLVSAHTTAVAALKTAITAVTYDTNDTTTIAAIAALLDDAEAARHITNTENGNILAAIVDPDSTATDDFATAATLNGVLANAVALVDAKSTDVASSEFTALVDILLNTGTGTSLDNPLSDALTSAENGVYNDGGTPDDLTDDSGAQFTIDHLAALVADEVAANAEVTDLTALNAAVTAAEATFTDADLLVPVSIVAGTQAATSGDDIYLVDTAIATANITSFGTAGSDSIYLGTEFTFNSGTLATDGDNAVLEVFLSEVAGSAVLSFETEVYGSDSTAVTESVVTLTGVDVADVTIADGFVTVA
ncbi:MAG: DUF4214 domain-containing protein [Marinobacter sp.]|jgi:hypothetical protein|nr:DUF4214 domain-containing protein [Marinobacter sp.]MCL1481501.1 DUF4214 domain-containing protein [Marinobacter sp.]